MKITLGKLDPATGMIRITFTDGEWIHTRTMNPVLGAAGVLDRKATRARAEEVARGLDHKRALGLI